MWSVPRGYIEDNRGDPVSCQLEVSLWRENQEAGAKRPPA
jgi:hypothetical protein